MDVRRGVVSARNRGGDDARSIDNFFPDEVAGMINWESLIAERILMHRDTYKPQLVEDARERNTKNRCNKWHKKHPEYAREWNRKHELEHPGEKAKRQKAWREKNKEHIRDYTREYMRRKKETDPEWYAERMRKKNEWMKNHYKQKKDAA